MNSYQKEREAIYSPLRAGRFDWDWLYDKEYALARPWPLTVADQAEIQAASDGLSRVFAKVTGAVQQSSDELLAELGLPQETWAAVRRPGLPNAATLIGRFDFARTPNGWKMLEFNSDTPGGVVEAFYVNGAVCRYYNLPDPNNGLAADLAEGFASALRSFGCENGDGIVFSALDWHKEDAGTACYLLEASGLPGRFVPLADLRVDDAGLWYQKNGARQPVAVWYRLHPLGILAGERDEDGFPSGALVLQHLARNRLISINPPGALIAQSKALQALIWGLHQAGEFFSGDEHAVIDRYMLPTYLEDRFSGRCSFVTKPILGREGGGITIFLPDGRVADQDPAPHHGEQAMVYQECVDLERVDLDTLEGRFAGHMIWGSFVIGGKPSAVVARAGGRITDDLAYFVPAYLVDGKTGG